MALGMIPSMPWDGNAYIDLCLDIRLAKKTK